MDTSELPIKAPTMGNIGKIRYTHQDMIDFLIANPAASQKELAGRYGYSQGWISNIMASDVWKAAFEARRKELIDPALSLTLEQQMEGLTRRSITVLMEKLEQPAVADTTVLKALELGAKASNLGGQNVPTGPSTADHLALLANRLIDLQSNVRKGQVYEGEATPV